MLRKYPAEALCGLLQLICMLHNILGAPAMSGMVLGAGETALKSKGVLSS